MSAQRDYDVEMKDNDVRKYAYDFDFDVMHGYMIRSFEPFFIKGPALELGSFKGDFTRRLQPHFDDITCVEASPEAIDEARGKLGAGVDFIHSTFEAARLPRQYDNIFLTHVLEHLDDPVGVLRRVNDEWLSPNGRLFLVCPNANAPSRQIAVKMGLISHNAAVTPGEREHGHRRTYSLDTLESDAVAAGLNVRCRSGVFFKALANFQWDRLLATDIISTAYLDGCYKLGQQYPDLCASISCFAKEAEMKISCVVAVYQNKGAVSLTHEKIKGVFAETLKDDEYEIVFVDDGSTDGSLDELLDIHRDDPRTRVITFTRNFGQMAAILAGMKEATGDAVINISADLQDPVTLIPQMIEKWKSGDEIVICHRVDRADDMAARLYSRFAYGMLRMSMPQMPEGGFDFVLMDRKVVDVFNSIDVRHRFFQGDLLWTGYRTSLIPYVRQARTIGKSQYNFSRKLKNFLDAVLDASYLPIRFISAAGVVTAGLGVIYAITIVIAWLFGATPFTGWAPIMVVLLLVGGMIMVMLGVIGEYIWRINEEVRKRPNFLIRQRFP